MQEVLEACREALQSDCTGDFLFVPANILCRTTDTANAEKCVYLQRPDV